MTRWLAILGLVLTAGGWFVAGWEARALWFERRGRDLETRAVTAAPEPELYRRASAQSVVRGKAGVGGEAVD